MSPDNHLGYRERARLMARAALAISIAPALFLIWQATGQPGIPGLEFGHPGSAYADPGLVVRIADTARTPLRATRLRSVAAGTAAPAREAHAIGSAVAISTAPARASIPSIASTGPATQAPDAIAPAGSSPATPVAHTVAVLRAALPVQPPTSPIAAIPVPTVPTPTVPPPLLVDGPTLH